MQKNSVGVRFGLNPEDTWCEVIDLPVTVLLLEVAGGRYGEMGQTFLAGCSGQKKCRVPVSDAGLRRWALKIVGCPLLGVPSLRFQDDLDHYAGR